MKQIVIAANWKMNTNLNEAIDLVTSLKKLLSSSVKATTIICPPFVYLPEINSILKDSNIYALHFLVLGWRLEVLGLVFQFLGFWFLVLGSRL